MGISLTWMKQLQLLGKNALTWKMNIPFRFRTEFVIRDQIWHRYSVNIQKIILWLCANIPKTIYICIIIFLKTYIKFINLTKDIQQVVHQQCSLFS